MDLVFSGFRRAFEMLINFDPELMVIIWTTLKVGASSIVLSVMIGIPLGMLIGLKSFVGKRILLTIVHVGMGLPPVVAGLWVTMALWRNGPLGNLSLLYTKEAIVIAQVLVAVPIIIGLTATAFQNIDRNMFLLIKSLGATRWQRMFLLIKETRFALYAAIIAGFGRVYAEVGAAMMVGGNLKGDTRILTTSIVMEVSKGNFDVAIALSIILMAIAFILTLVLTFFQQRSKPL